MASTDLPTAHLQFGGMVFIQKAMKMAIEIVDLPMKNGGSFYSYVKLPEGIS